MQHFPTKHELVVECAKRARRERRNQFQLIRPDSSAEAYVDTVHAAMEQAREWRFLMRDREQFRKGTKARRPDLDSAGFRPISIPNCPESRNAISPSSPSDRSPPYRLGSRPTGKAARRARARLRAECRTASA